MGTGGARAREAPLGATGSGGAPGMPARGRSGRRRRTCCRRCAGHRRGGRWRERTRGRGRLARGPLENRRGRRRGRRALPATTIWIAGDSTVMTYPEPNTDGNNMISIYGWGQEIGQFFSSKVTINNQAIGGRSVAFFMWSVVTDSSGAYQCVDDQGTPEFQMTNGNKVNTSQWSRILNGMKAGDFLLIQFGTNDETHTCPRYVSLPDFETDFGVMADAARRRAPRPIFVTPMGHRSFSGTTATNTLLPYANAMKAEATLKTVEVEDLNLESEAYYTSVGSASWRPTSSTEGPRTSSRRAPWRWRRSSWPRCEEQRSPSPATSNSYSREA